MVDFDESTHTFWWHGIEIPSVSKVMREAAIQPDISFLDPKYRERGTAVHTLTELIDAGNFDYSLVTEEYLPYVSAYEWFLDDNEVEWEASEEIVFSKKYFFAGILDRRGAVEGRSCIMDIKSGLYAKWHQVQTAAYRIAKDLECSEYDLYLSKDGAYRLRENKKPNQDKVFLDAVNLYWYRHEMDYKRLLKVRDK